MPESLKTLPKAIKLEIEIKKMTKKLRLIQYFGFVY